MKTFRKIIFWTHLILGCLAAIIILLMSITGVLLTYEKQMTAWADNRIIPSLIPSSNSQRLPIETLINKAREAKPNTPLTSISIKSEAPSRAAFSYRGGILFLNAHTGEVLGEGSKGAREFFHVVTDLHRWLAVHGEGRDTARAITGAANFAFLLIVIGGIYIWFPKKFTWIQFKNILWFKRGLSSKARDFNWHNVIGFWSFIPLFIVVLSALPISYTWAGNLVYKIVGEEPPKRQAPPPSQNASNGPKQIDSSALDGVNKSWGIAERHVSGWVSINMPIPNSGKAPLMFSIDKGNAGQPQHRGSLTLDRISGNIVKWEPFSNLSTGRRLRSILRFAHTGEVLGITGQTIAGIVSLGAVFLVYTGLTLSIRRLLAWVKRRRVQQVAEEVINV